MSKLDKIRALKELIKTDTINKEESLKQLKDLIINSNLNTYEIEELDAFYISIETHNALKAKLESFEISIAKNMSENKELRRILSLDKAEIRRLKNSGHHLLN